MSMSYSTPFITKPRAVSMVHTNTSTSRNSGEYANYSQIFIKTSQRRSSTTSAPVYSPTPNMKGRSVPEHAYYSQLRSSNAAERGDGDETGDDSDYFNESTPAWKKTQHAVPRVRVVGFHVSSPYAPRSGGSDTSYNPESGQTPRESTAVRSGSSRQPTVSSRSDAVCRESFQSASDKPHLSHAPASIPHHRNDTRNVTFARGSERRKTLTSGN